MREKLVKRFYCDHCGKGRFHRSAMKRHELACINNPARVCPLCSECKLPQVPMTELIAAVDYTRLQPLREKANGCPACMLAAIVQSKQGCYADEDDRWIPFNYKEERDKWWSHMAQDNAGNPIGPFTIEY